MAKSIRSKVKKRLRSVKRSVIKKQRQDPTSKLGEGAAKALELLKEASTGHIAPREARSPARRAAARASAGMPRRTRNFLECTATAERVRACARRFTPRASPRRRPHVTQPHPSNPTPPPPPPPHPPPTPPRHPPPPAPPPPPPPPNPPPPPPASPARSQEGQERLPLR